MDSNLFIRFIRCIEFDRSEVCVVVVDAAMGGRAAIIRACGRDLLRTWRLIEAIGLEGVLRVQVVKFAGEKKIVVIWEIVREKLINQMSRISSIAYPAEHDHEPHATQIFGVRGADVA